MKIEASVIIDRSSSEVFQFSGHEHYTNHPRWDPHVVSLEPLNAKPIGLGERFKLVRHVMGRQQENIFEVTQWEPPARMTIATTAPFRLQLASLCEPIDIGHTKLTLVGEAHLSGPRGLLAPLFRRRLEADAQANLQRMKVMIEAR